LGRCHFPLTAALSGFIRASAPADGDPLSRRERVPVADQLGG